MNRKLFLQVVSLFLFLTVTLISPSMVSAVSQGRNALNTQLLYLAQTKLNAEYDILVTGDSTKLTENEAVTTLAIQQVNDVATAQIKRNKMLAEHGQKYTKAISTLTIEKIDIQGSQATITAKEQVTLTLIDKNSTDPVYTKEEKYHVFHYSLEGKKWNLVEDDVANPFTPINPDAGAQKVNEKPIDITLLKKSAPQSMKTEDVSGQAAPLVTAMAGTFNPTSAVNYARSYWSNYNGAYRTYGNDCTNFISQAMNWSGWQHIGGWYDDAHYWWYSNNPIAQWGGRAEARSWINVHYFYFFSRYTGRGYNAQYLSDFRLGDTLQVDFGTPDGILDHNTIVTKNNGGGNIFLTYHSTNTLDKSIWDFIAQTPGANYYGTLMKYSY